jgi:hypothetical protein
MPTRSPPAALPLLSWQRPSLCICKEWIDGGVFLVVSIHGVEFFTNTRKSLAVDICSHGIRIKLATRPAPCLRESVSLFEQGVRNRNCGFHELSITVVIPCFKRNNPASPRAFVKSLFSAPGNAGTTRMAEFSLLDAMTQIDPLRPACNDRFGLLSFPLERARLCGRHNLDLQRYAPQPGNHLLSAKPDTPRDPSSRDRAVRHDTRQWLHRVMFHS